MGRSKTLSYLEIIWLGSSLNICVCHTKNHATWYINSLNKKYITKKYYNVTKKSYISHIKSVFVFEATHAFSLNVMYLVFGYRYQKCIKMTGPTTCLRLDLGYGKAIFSCFLHVGPQVEPSGSTKSIQKLHLHPLLSPLIHFDSHSFLFQFNLTAKIQIAQSPLLLHNPQNDYCNVSFFSFICH
jgi:hypothetical protein